MFKDKFTREFFVDAGERVISTFIQAFLGFIVPSTIIAVSNDATQLKPVLLSALGAGIAAALSAVKAIVASLKLDTVSPASFASTEEPPLDEVGELGDAE